MRNKKTISEIIEETLNMVSEGLKSPIPVELRKVKTGYIGDFTIDNNHYRITINETSEDCYVFKFTRDDSYELTSDIKKAFQVIPTINKVAEDFIIEHKPNLFSFFMVDGSNGRDKRYGLFVNEMSNKYGYQVNIKTYGEKSKSYILFNENVSDNDFKSLIDYIQKYLQ